MQTILSVTLKKQSVLHRQTTAVGERCPEGGLVKLVSLSILVVDDSRVWRQSVCSLLHRHMDRVIICEGSDGLEAVQKSEELQPDLVLLDIGLPNLNGLEAARLIRSVAPRSRILFVSSYDWPELSYEAMNLGALGFVMKSKAARDLLPAISTILRDERFFGSEVSPLDPTQPPRT
jgi:DNA-binding NarL/FixJ family response regulator